MDESNTEIITASSHTSFARNIQFIESSRNRTCKN